MLKGTFTVLSLPGLLQVLCAEGRTGRLDVNASTTGSSSRGALWLEDGRIAHASYEGVMPGPRVVRLVGEEAVYQLASAEAGSFAFDLTEVAPEHSISAATEQLLLEAACRRDHARRAASSAVLPSAVPAFAPVPEGSTTPRFNTLQWRLLASIDGRKDIAGLSQELGVPVPVASTLINELVSGGVLLLS